MQRLKGNINRILRVYFIGILLLSFCAIFALANVFHPGQFSHPFLLALIVIVITLIAYAFMQLFIAKTIITPTKEIQKAIGRISGGISSTRIETAQIPLDELRELADAINALADKSSRDISELKKLEQVRSQFLGNVSHELRTPIFSIQGYLETLLDGAIDDQEVRRKFVERSHANAIRLNVLLSDLIDISKIESGEMRMSYRYFNIADMIRDVMHSLEYQADQYSVTMSTNVGDAEILVYGDKERLSQALTNLTENAIKYNKPGGTVTILVEPENEKVKVSVKDTGIGIEGEHKDRIFERFYRVDKNRSRAVGGSGLGLAIVKHILEAHQTSPSIESIAGEGTTISFILKQ